MSGTDAVVGASDHYARAELVTLALERGAPVLVDRRGVRLIGEGLPSAPYHHEALQMEPAAAAELVERVRRSVAEHADAAIAELLAAHPNVRALALQQSPFPRLPDTLDAVLRSRPLTNAADGMLYREALVASAATHGLEVFRHPRKSDPVTLAADALGTDPATVTAHVTRLGREAGPPWRQDQKRAAAAALWALGGGVTPDAGERIGHRLR